MKRQNFDLNWHFSLNDGEEILVNLPHDFSIGQPRSPDSRMKDSGGYFQGGNGKYRKILYLPEDMKDSVIQLEIEGAYMNTQVYVNGNMAMFHPYGYTSFIVDMTPWLEFGKDNTIEIHVRNDALPNSRWYSGSGLYRHVWLLTGKDLYFRPWGIFVTTPVVSRENSVVKVEADIIGCGLLNLTLLDMNGNSVATGESSVKSGKNSIELNVAESVLWCPENPYLYTLVSELISGDKVADRIETKIGIRSIELDREKGLLLNGEPIKLKGGCVHHDCGILGAASWDLAEERKVKAHKDAGFNAIRCAHNPPSPAFLDACDRLGILVMDEAFDCWRMGKKPYDYHLYFEYYWKRDLSSMVLRDRNHPSVIIWSTGNEIPERLGASNGYEISAMLASAIRELDNTRPIINALNGFWLEWTEEMTEKSAPFVEPLDIMGLNYHWRAYDDVLEKYPDRFIIGTETLPKEAFENQQMAEKHPRVLGDFVWTSLDYIGEAGIGHAYLPEEDSRTHGLPYPWRLANCGDLDILCRPRPQSFYRQILWGHRTKPYIAVHRPNNRGIKAEPNYWGWWDVHHSWSWPGSEGCKIFIDVYSHGDEVELFQNGISLGRKKAGATEKNIASFETRYVPGELKVIAYKDGRPVGEDTLQTCGIPHAIRLETDKTSMGSAWGNIAYVTASIIDAKGNVVPYACNEVTFELSGPGNLLAVGNSNPCTEDSFIGVHMKAYEGVVMAVINTTSKTGNISLTASAYRLKPATLTIEIVD